MTTIDIIMGCAMWLTIVFVILFFIGGVLAIGLAPFALCFWIAREVMARWK